MSELISQDILRLDMVARHVPSIRTKKLGYASAELLALYTIRHPRIVVIVMLQSLKEKTALCPGAFVGALANMLGCSSASKPTSYSRHHCICHQGGMNAWKEGMVDRNPVHSLLS